MYLDYAKIRDSKGFTDYAVAKGAGIGRSTLSDWKSGSHVPHIQNLQKIAAFLDVSVDDLMPQIPVLEAPEAKAIPGLVRNYSQEEIEKAMRLYEKYKDSPQQIQNAVEVLLKPGQSDS
jgi:transcriptional regulator with XRE-family HTH domain